MSSAFSVQGYLHQDLVSGNTENQIGFSILPKRLCPLTKPIKCIQYYPQSNELIENRYGNTLIFSFQIIAWKSLRSES